MALAHAAGVRVFATGGIGGAHREPSSFDISADLTELSRTPVLVVCAGAKSILDLPRTLEVLETLGVPVLGYRTDEFPAFYVRGSRRAGVVPGGDAGRGGGGVRGARRGWAAAGRCWPAVPGGRGGPGRRSSTRRCGQAELDAAAEGVARPGGDAVPAGAAGGADRRQDAGREPALIVANARLAAEVAGALCL